MDRCALFVDAGYVLADGAMAVHGTRNRESVSWDYAGVLQFLGSVARDRTGLPLLRCYWYEAAVEGHRTAEHDTLADLPGVKLRLGPMRPGRREGVEGEIRRDLTVLARNGAVTDALVVSAEEDLAQVIADVQDLGIRVTIVHILVGRNWTISRSLRQECDDIVEIGEAHLRPYVELVVGAEPVPDDDRREAGAYSGRPPANGHGRVGALGNQQALPVGARANAPSIYTAPVVAEYQRSVQPATANGRPGFEPAASAPEPLAGTVPGRQVSPELEPLPVQAASAVPEAGEQSRVGVGPPGPEPGVAETPGAASQEHLAGLGQSFTHGSTSQGGPAGPGMPPQHAQQPLGMAGQQDPSMPAPLQPPPGHAAPVPAAPEPAPGGPAPGGQEHGEPMLGQHAQHQHGFGPPPPSASQPSSASQQGQRREAGQHGLHSMPEAAGLPEQLTAPAGQPGGARTPHQAEQLPGTPDPQDIQLAAQAQGAPAPGSGQQEPGQPVRVDHGQPGRVDHGQPGRVEQGQPGRMAPSADRSDLEQVGQHRQVPVAGPAGMPGPGGLPQRLAPAPGQPGAARMTQQPPQASGGPGQEEPAAPASHGPPSVPSMQATQPVYQAAPPLSPDFPGPGQEGPHGQVPQGQVPQGQVPGGLRQVMPSPPAGSSHAGGPSPVPAWPPVAPGRQFEESHQYDSPGQYQSRPPDQMPAAQQFGGMPPGHPETGIPGPGYVPQQGAHSGPQVGRPPHAPVQPPVVSLAEAVQAAHGEGFSFGQTVARDAPALWLEAVLARKPRMPSDLEARLLQDSALPIDSLLHDEVRHALRRGFWDALERSRH